MESGLHIGYGQHSTETYPLKLIRFLLLAIVFLPLFACEVEFTPEITPLIIPTVHSQAFETISPDHAEQTVLPSNDLDVPRFQAAPDNDDPLAWIAAIETRWAGIDVITCEGIEFLANCTPWTAREAKLLYETLEEFIFFDYLDGQLRFVMTEDADWSGSMDRGIQEGILTADIWISDTAWRTPPAAGLFDIFDPLFRKSKYFQSTLAHELTHAANWFHPELLNWWINEKESAGFKLEPGDWRLGWMYDWSVYDEFRDDPEVYERIIEEELFAMSVASLMYDPWWNQARE